MENKALKDYENYLRFIKNRSEGTIFEYVRDLESFFEWYAMESSCKKITDKELKDITQFDVYEYISKCAEQGNCAKTRARKIASIKAFYNFLEKQKGIESSVRLVEKPKIEKAIPHYLTLEEALHLLEVAKTPINDSDMASYIAIRNHCIITLFLNCGFRLNELANLKVDDIKSNNTIIVKGKGAKERTIYLNDTCVESIKEYLAIRDSEIDYLFTNYDKSQISRQGIQHMVKENLIRSGLGQYHTHTLRHTAATLMYQYGGVDILCLKEILGHESVATTQIYSHCNDNQLANAVASNPLNAKTLDKVVAIA